MVQDVSENRHLLPLVPSFQTGNRLQEALPLLGFFPRASKLVFDHINFEGSRAFIKKPQRALRTQREEGLEDYSIFNQIDFYPS